MEKTLNRRFPIAGIFLLWECIFEFISCFGSSIPFGISICRLLSALFLCFLLFRKQHSPLLAIGITIYSVCIIITPFNGISIFLPPILVAVFSICMLFPCGEKIKQYAKKFWLVPAICSFIFIILSTVPFFVLLLAIIRCLFTLSLCKWIADPSERFQEQTYDDESLDAIDSAAAFGLFPHILLLLLSFGIWQSIWVYKTTKYLNHANGFKQRSPGLCLLFYWLVPFYSFYWYYNAGRRVEAISLKRKLPCSVAGLCLLFSIFFGIIPSIILQDKINCIAKAVQMKNQFSSEPQKTANLEDLKKLKDLLDSGIISEEEFQQKKTQILNL